MSDEKETVEQPEIEWAVRTLQKLPEDQLYDIVNENLLRDEPTEDAVTVSYEIAELNKNAARIATALEQIVELWKQTPWGKQPSEHT
jgi:hypothetical protein